MPDIVVSDIAAMKIAASIDALTLFQTENVLTTAALVGTTFGVAASRIPGTIPAILATQAATQSDILKLIDAQTKSLNKMQLAIGGLSQSVQTVTTAAANIQYTLNQQLTTQQFMAADQIKNNKFQQMATNASLERAKLPTIEVKPDDMKTAIVTGFNDISVIKAQATVIDYASNAITSAATEGFKISQQWVAQTAVGKFISSYAAEYEIQAKLIFAKDDAKAELIKQLDDIRTARNTAGASKS
jgi:hypothetical protein